MSCDIFALEVICYLALDLSIDRLLGLQAVPGAAGLDRLIRSR